jgi:hypothetical protein
VLNDWVLLIVMTSDERNYCVDDELAVECCRMIAIVGKLAVDRVAIGV